MNSRGYSVLELLVCLAILGGALGAAWQIWGYSLQLSTATGRAALDSSLTATTSALRRDVQTALPLPDQESRWSSRSLALHGPDARTVTYSVHAGDLARTETSASGTTNRRRLASGVTGWRWRLLTPDLLELQVTLSVHPNPVAVAGRPSTKGAHELVQATRTIRLCRRGGFGGKQW